MTLLGLQQKNLYKNGDFYLWIEKIDDSNNIIGKQYFELTDHNPMTFFYNIYNKRDQNLFATMYKNLELVNISKEIMFKYLFENIEKELFNFFFKKIKNGLVIKNVLNESFYLINQYSTDINNKIKKSIVKANKIKKVKKYRKRFVRR